MEATEEPLDRNAGTLGDSIAWKVAEPIGYDCFAGEVPTLGGIRSALGHKTFERLSPHSDMAARPEVPLSSSP